MGMFDYLTCEHPLPGYDGDPSKLKFQTKDLGRWLYHWRIRVDGKLERLFYDVVPDGEPRQHPFVESWLDWQPTKRANIRWKWESHISHDVNFHDGERAYVARVRQGRLVWIENTSSRLWFQRKDSPRWHADVTYRSTELGEVVVEHDFEELHELHKLVERGPDWNAIVNVYVTLNRRADYDTLEGADGR